MLSALQSATSDINCICPHKNEQFRLDYTSGGHTARSLLPIGILDYTLIDISKETLYVIQHLKSIQLSIHIEQPPLSWYLAKKEYTAYRTELHV